MIINRQNLSDLFVAFKAAFNTGFREAQDDSMQISTEVPSTTAENHYAWLGQFPKLREWLGDRVVKLMASYDYRIRNKSFESTIEVDRDDMEDDNHGVYTPLFQEAGHASKTHRPELVFGLLANGFTELCYDGQPFFDADHPVGPQGEEVSVSNMQAGGGNPWFLIDNSRALKPIIFQMRRPYQLVRQDDPSSSESVFMRKKYRYGVDARVNVGFGFWQQAFGSKATLDQTNFNAALAAMMAFKSDEGRPLGIRPRLLVCGPSNRAAALEVIKAEKIDNGKTNINRDAVDVLVVPWLA